MNKNDRNDRFFTVKANIRTAEFAAVGEAYKASDLLAYHRLERESFDSSRISAEGIVISTSAVSNAAGANPGNSSQQAREPDLVP